MRQDKSVARLSFLIAGVMAGALAFGQTGPAGRDVDRGPFLQTVVPVEIEWLTPTPPASPADGPGTFRFVLESDPETLQRAFLVYELEGLPRGSAALRSVGGLPPQWGLPALATATEELRVEEISPRWLRRGPNEVRFGSVMSGDSLPNALTDLRELARTAGGDTVAYEVRSLHLAVVADDGRALVTAAASSSPEPSPMAAALVDGDLATGWDGSDDPRNLFKGTVDLPFRRRAQAHTLELATSRRTAGQLVVEALLSGGSSVLAREPIEMAALEPGRHRLPLEPGLPAATGIRLSWSPADDDPSTLAEVQVLASPVGSRADMPRLTLSGPPAAWGDRGGIRLTGFVEPAANASGKAELYVDGVHVAGGVHAEDGAFDLFVPHISVQRDGDEPGTVEVELVYPDGTRLSKTVGLRGEADGDDGEPRDKSAKKRFEQRVNPDEQATLEYQGVRLDIPAGAVDREVTLTIEALAADEVAELDAGMTNVTTPHLCYRFGPDGLKFAKPIRITLPFDSGKVPAGLAADDVRSYFFDEESGRWMEVERLEVDAQADTVSSLTDHFTDFVNATLTVPDHPSGTDLTSSSLQELSEADPGAGITVIEAPGASPSGDAELSFPLEVPPGRRGMQPDLELTYSSRGADGWLGLGWDLRLPAVEVDTVFGVPRYRADRESETYLLNGRYLAPTADPEAARQSDRVFTLRVEGSFQRVVRRGSRPDDYWWEVTDQDGTRFVYGQSDQARLRDYEAPHNVFRWHLEQVVDVHGNTVDYTYAADSGSNGEPWTRLYPSRIDYTGTQGAGGHYQVLFVLDGGERPDKLSSGLSGFKVYTRFRLAHADVLAGGALVRRYRFQYREGDFGKSLLEAIVVLGEDGESEFYRHAFEYFAMPRQDDGFDGFEAQDVWGRLGSSADAGQQVNVSGGGHAFVGVGDPLTCQPEHVGAQVGVNAGDSLTLKGFFDVNGDGLPDRVTSDDRVELNHYDPATDEGSFSSTGFPGSQILGASLDLSFDFGGGSHVNDQVQIGANWLWNHVHDFRTVSDVNGDGLPDLVTALGDFKARLNTGSSFVGESAWSGFDLGGLDLELPQQDEEVFEEFRLSNALRKLVLPYGGQVIIDGAIAKKEAAGEDGVEVSIYRNNNRVWHRTFAPGDTAPCVPAANNACGAGLGLDVDSEDRLYFIADAVAETGGDALAWAPRVTYAGRDTGLVEPHGAALFRFDAGRDFRIAGLPGGGWLATAGGEVLVSGALVKQPTADHVVATIEKNGEVVYTRNLNAASSGTFDDVPPIPVAREDVLTFHLASDAQVDPDRVRWTPTVSYEGGTYCRPVLQGEGEVCGAVTCGADPASGEVSCELAGDPTPEIPLQPEEITRPAQVLTDVHRLLPLNAVTQSWRAPHTGTFTFNVHWTGSLSRSFPVQIYVQGRHRLIRKRTPAASAPGVVFTVTTSATAGERLYFTVVAERRSERGQLAVRLRRIENGQVVLVPVPVNRRYRIRDEVLLSQDDCRILQGECDVLSGGYHGWFYGEWDGNVPFRESGFRDRDEDTPKDYVAATPRWQGVDGSPGPVWQAAGFDLYLAADGVKPSRRGMNAVVELRRAAGSGNGVSLLRKAFGRTTSLEASVSGPGSSVGGAVSLGSNATQIDFLDMNGDRYPDQVSRGRVRFSGGHGDFGPLEDVPRLDRRMPCGDVLDELTGLGRNIRCSQDGSVDTTTGLGVTYSRENSDGEPEEVTSPLPSAGRATSLNQARVDLVDVNGDGLPDRVGMAPGAGTVTVHLNLGYRFGAAETWPLPGWTWDGSDRCQEGLDFLSAGVLGLIDDLGDPDVLRYTLSASDHAGIAFGPFGGGVSTSLSRTLVEMADVNGDGLPDHVSKDHGEDFFRVKINHGDSWGEEQRWHVPDWQTSLGGLFNPLGLFRCLDAVSLSGTISGNGSIGAPLCITIIPEVPVIGIRIEVSAQLAGGEGGLQLSFEDVDGDGLADHVLKKNGDRNVYVKRNKARKVNLLRTVHRPLGGRIALDYRRQGNRVERSVPEHRTDMPVNQWVLASTVLHDGRGNAYPMSYEYFNDAFFDRLERTEYGYARVRETRPDGSTVDTHFHNQDFYRRNLPFKVVAADAAGRLFGVETMDWQLRPVAPGSFFPALASEASFFYEGTTTSETAFRKSTRRAFEHDALGHVVGYANFVDEGPADDVLATIEYHADPNRYIFAPAVLEARDARGRLLRKRSATYDGLGRLVRLEQTLVGGRDPATGNPYTGSRNAVHSFSYDAFGNLASVTDPVGFELAFTYDPVVRTHVSGIRDSFGYTTRTGYDLRYGLPVETVDKNGNRLRQAYDLFGRLVRVFGPYEVGGAATLELEYAPHARPAFAVVHHKDVTRSDPIDMALFVDGLGRTLQSKKDAELDLGTGSGTRVGMQVSGRVEFDVKGRVAAEGQPVFDTGPAARFVDVAPRHPTRVVYDVLDRVREVRFPEDARTRVDYGFGTLDGVERLLVTRTDAEGKATRTYLDVTGVVVGVEQSNRIRGARRTLITRYGYNAMVELTSVTDAAGNVTTVEYDTLGRRTVIDNPDAGRSEQRYDLAGNLGARISANLAARGQQIRLFYTFNRLDRIDYPDMTDVVFTYGAPGAPFNRADRVVTVSGESGVEELFYGRLGETVQTVKTAIALNGFSPKGPYTTTSEYDSLGRLLSMTYPDGEVLTYGFDAGGNVKTAAGLLRGTRYDYLVHQGYDEFGDPARVVYGNGVETRFTYDPRSRFLSRLGTVERSGRELQDLRYTFDKVGSILELANDVPLPRPSQKGGPTLQGFRYDDLYQLINAEGSYRFPPNKETTYSLAMAYDETGNITGKSQVHHRLQPGGKALLQKKTSYDRTYQYGAAQPHAVTHLGERTFHYDLNGNQTGWQHDRTGQRRTVTWDEENRVKAVADNGRTTRFLYDSGGVRTNKQGRHGETIYVNRFFTVRNGAIGSKHVFVDDVRVASKVAQPSINAAPPPPGPAEEKRFFYHGDHLGSTHYVTDQAGELFQHLEYFPSGELWVSERSGTRGTPFLFGGKELDEGTGLSYFGARYYEPRQGQWVSPDPILDGMLEIDGSAVADSSVLPFVLPGHTYAFAANNLLNMVDPNGLRAKCALTAGSRFVRPFTSTLPISPRVVPRTASLVITQPFSTSATDDDIGDLPATFLLLRKTSSANTNTVSGPPGPAQFTADLNQQDSEETVLVLQDQFVNRAFDSGSGEEKERSGPLGTSLSPGSGVPTTAEEAIAERGLGIFFPNNGEAAAIFQVIAPLTATRRRAIGGSAQELLIGRKDLVKLRPVVQHPVVSQNKSKQFRK